jgi:hypothetical protein
MKTELEEYLANLNLIFTTHYAGPRYGRHTDNKTRYYKTHAWSVSISGQQFDYIQGDAYLEMYKNPYHRP